MLSLETLVILAGGILGLLVGSFLNVVAIRLLQGSSVVFPSSHCMKCNTVLKPFELIPIFSYIMLRGKCRSCKVSISPIYPLGELITALLFMLFTKELGLDPELLAGFIFISIMVIIFHTDLKERVIHDRVVLFGLVLIVPIRLFFSQPLAVWNYILAALVVGSFLYMLAAISKGGFGGGDIKLFALIGLYIGMKATLLTLFVASLLGYLCGILVRLRRGREDVKVIPFGPYIAIAGVLSYLWGEQLFDWYWGLFSN